MIALFILKLSAGITLMWLLMPRRDVTDGFFRIQMRLVLGTTVLAALLLSGGTTWSAPSVTASAATIHSAADRAVETASLVRWFQIAAALVSYPGSIVWALGRRKPGNIAIRLMAGLCGASVILHSVRVPNHGSLILQVFSDTASCCVTGAMLTAMLLGHWYLTTPTMSTRPLLWFTWAIVVSAALRLVASAVGFWQFGSSDFVAWDTTRGLWLATRLVGGIAVPMVVAALVWRIMKYRNTQSATGVLFAGLILVFMGEMAGSLLERDLRVPF